MKMFSILNVFKYFQIIILLTVLFGINTYDEAYEYDYPPGEADHSYQDYSPGQNPRIMLRANFKRAPKRDKLFEDLLNPNLSTADADSRVPIVEEPIRARSSGACPDSKCFKCLDSCRYLKKSRVAVNSLVQYTYLRLCSMGCKEELDCLANNYCLPVMQENPDYFVQCSNKCNLFLIVPKIFKTGNTC